MPWSSKHIEWLVDTGERLKTADGKEVEVWRFHHRNNNGVLSAWARHFRNHYCLDTDIDLSVTKIKQPFFPVHSSTYIHQEKMYYF